MKSYRYGTDMKTRLLAGKGGGKAWFPSGQHLARKLRALIRGTRCRYAQGRSSTCSWRWQRLSSPPATLNCKLRRPVAGKSTKWMEGLVGKSMEKSSRTGRFPGLKEEVPSFLMVEVNRGEAWDNRLIAIVCLTKMLFRCVWYSLTYLGVLVVDAVNEPYIHPHCITLHINLSTFFFL